VLQERKLSLSGKKTRIGSINKGFHFLGIQYPETQPLDNITRQAVSRSFNKGTSELNLSYVGGGVEATWQPEEQSLLQTRIVPHARTLRKAREQVKWMVRDGVSPRRIISYLHR